MRLLKEPSLNNMSRTKQGINQDVNLSQLDDQKAIFLSLLHRIVIRNGNPHYTEKALALIKQRNVNQVSQEPVQAQRSLYERLYGKKPG